MALDVVVGDGEPVYFLSGHNTLLCQWLYHNTPADSLHTRVIIKDMVSSGIRELRELVRSILLEGVYDPGILKAVFMAGGPGSGKSFTARVLFGADRKAMITSMSASGLKIINSDPVFEKLLKDAGVSLGDLGKIADEDPELAYQLGLDDERGVPADSPRGVAKRSKDLAIKRFTRPEARLGVILDGTGDDFEKIVKKKNALEELGYDTYMVYVNTTLEVAQERNRNRERTMSAEKVEEIWTDVAQNLGEFQSLFGNQNLIIVDNTVYGPIPDKLESAVDQFLARSIRNPIGRRWIEDQLSQRGGGTRKERQKLLGKS